MRILPYLDGTMAAVRSILSKLLSIKWRHALKPRNLFAWHDDNNIDSSSPRHSTTAWLDGARGISALQVYFFHFMISGYADPLVTYGSRPEVNQYYQHPLLRPLWSGGASSVCNFLVISGYALTTNSFLLMREGRHDELYRRLCSSVLRRWFRLWPPVIIVSLPMIFFYQYWPYAGMLQPSRKESLREEIAYFVSQIDSIVQPFPYLTRNGLYWRFEYVMQAWTIPLEFYCSMVCYLVVMLVCNMPSFRHRGAIVGFLAFYTMHHASYWTSLFLVGTLLADWNLEQYYRQRTSTNGTPWQPTSAITTPNGDSYNHIIEPKQPSIKSNSTMLWTIFNQLIFFSGYYLSGMPMQFPEQDPYVPKPGYETFYKLIPPKWLIDIDFEIRWYQSLSAVFLVYSVSQSARLRGVCETRFAQWLGRISFALYLVHAQMISIFSGYFRLLFGYVTGWRQGLGVLMFVYELVSMSVLVFATAAFVWRYIDKPSVKFSRRLDEVLTGRRR